MNKMIRVGLPSKGRLRKDSLKIFKKNKLFVKDSKRNYLSEIKNFTSNEIIFSHAREIIERLADNSLDVGISGYDLLKESLSGIQKKIKIQSRLSFGFAELVVAVPAVWIDVQTLADLDEVSFDFKDKNVGKLRVATKYSNLTNEFLLSKGLNQYKIVNSLGSTEIYPFTNQSEIITDITSTGDTLKATRLRILKDGGILKSSACILVSKKSLRDKHKKKIIKKLLSKLKFL
jgi:ATP phosphoribosyltransferase